MSSSCRRIAKLTADGLLGLRIALLASALLLPPTYAAAQPQSPSQEEQEARSDGIVRLSLDEAVRLAQERSFRVARSRRNRQIAELQYRNARSGYSPRADAGVYLEQGARALRYETERFEFAQQVRGEFRGTAYGYVAVPVDIADVVGRQVAQADAGREIQTTDLAQATLDAAYDAQLHYLSALRAQNAVEADERVVQQIEALLTASRQRPSGVVPFLAVELANAGQALSGSRLAADDAQQGLRQALRLPPGTRLRLTSPLNGRVPAGDRRHILQRAVDARPELRQALLRIAQADLAIQQIGDHRRPRLSVGGFFSETLWAGSMFDGDRTRIRQYGLGVSLNVPIAQYDGGQLSRHRRIAELHREQLTADAAELQERIAYDLRQALLALDRAEARLAGLPDLEQAVASLTRAEQEMLRAAPTQAQGALAQVSNARAAWRAAVTASGDAQFEYRTAMFRLNRIIGIPHDAEESPTTGNPVPVIGGTPAARR